MTFQHFRTTTLKPLIDQAIAAEGSTVILWGDLDEAVVLCHNQPNWEIIRHPAVGWESECSKRGPSTSGFAWQGVRYAAAGEILKNLHKSMNNKELREIYDDLFHAQQARVLNRLGNVDLRGQATA